MLGICYIPDTVLGIWSLHFNERRNQGSCVWSQRLHTAQLWEKGAPCMKTMMCTVLSALMQYCSPGDRQQRSQIIQEQDNCYEENSMVYKTEVD
jgi:hypothetical protein